MSARQATLKQLQLQSRCVGGYYVGAWQRAEPQLHRHRDGGYYVRARQHRQSDGGGYVSARQSAAAQVHRHHGDGGG